MLTLLAALLVLAGCGQGGAETAPETVPQTEAAAMHRLASIRCITSSGSDGDSYTLSYNGEGHIEGLLHRYSFGYEEQLEFDSQGRLVTLTGLEEDGAVSSVTHYEYSGGLLTQVTHKAEEYSSGIEYTYREDGQLSFERHWDSYSGDLDALTRSYEYNEAGQLIRRRDFILVSNYSHTVTDYTYNNLGQLVAEYRECFEDLKQAPIGYTSTTYVYDSQGRVEQETYVEDIYGNGGTWEIRYDHSQEGLILKLATGTDQRATVVLLHDLTGEPMVEFSLFAAPTVQRTDDLLTALETDSGSCEFVYEAYSEPQ